MGWRNLLCSMWTSPEEKVRWFFTLADPWYWMKKLLPVLSLIPDSLWAQAQLWALPLQNVEKTSFISASVEGQGGHLSPRSLNPRSSSLLGFRAVCILSSSSSNPFLGGVAALTAKAACALSQNGWLEHSFWKTSFEPFHPKERRWAGEPHVQPLVAVLAPAWLHVSPELGVIAPALGRLGRTT